MAKANRRVDHDSRKSGQAGSHKQGLGLGLLIVKVLYNHRHDVVSRDVKAQQLTDLQGAVSNLRLVV